MKSIILSQISAFLAIIIMTINANAGDKPNSPDERKAVIKEIAAAIYQTESPEIIFICTHNSRRSHLAQVSMAIEAEKRGIELNTYSGGTEATALNINAYNAMVDNGVPITKTESVVAGKNYIHELRLASGTQELFSKKYSHDVNPKNGFIAIMVCSDADEACPYVEGAEYRFALPYVDPKISDGTGEESKVYGERFRQIRSEMIEILYEVQKLIDSED